MLFIKVLLAGLIIAPALAACISSPPPMSAQAADPPGITVTFVPACHTSSALKGRVTGVKPADYRVAVYLYTTGWYNKPTWAKPLTKIAASGKWSTDVTTGRGDAAATQFAAFLVPKDYELPILKGDDLPAALYTDAAAYVVKTRHCGTRELEFSGYTWQVKSSSGLVGPGPNTFSKRSSDVFVDSKGRLHMKIVKRKGKWYSTEVVNESVLGYGTYVFHIASRVDQLDPSVVLGLFTWDDTSPDYFHREIDIEFARWGVPVDPNSQFVVQPFTTAGNITRFNTVLAKKQKSTHGFDWQPGQIVFQSLYGDRPFPSADNQIAAFTYTGPDIPPTGSENVRINLWLFNGAPPTNRRAVHVIIDRFEFIPAP